MEPSIPENCNDSSNLGFGGGKLKSSLGKDLLPDCQFFKYRKHAHLFLVFLITYIS